MNEPILVLDHPIYKLTPRSTAFVKKLWYHFDTKCIKCNRSGTFNTDLGGWGACITHMIPWIIQNFDSSEDAEYGEYWKNLYLTAIREFLNKYPELALEG